MKNKEKVINISKQICNGSKIEIKLNVSTKITKALGFNFSFSNEPLINITSDSIEVLMNTGEDTFAVIPSSNAKYFYMERVGDGAIYIESITVYTLM